MKVKPLAGMYALLMTNLIYSDKSLIHLADTDNEQQICVGKWLRSNKLSPNIVKTNFVIFHCHQKRIPTSISLKINNNLIKQEQRVRYLGILDWKPHMHEISKEINRSIEVLYTPV